MTMGITNDNYWQILERIKLPLLGGVLLSISSTSSLLDFSKVFGCSQFLRTTLNSYKLIRSNHQNTSHILYDHQNLFIAVGLISSGLIFRIFSNFINLNLNRGNSNHPSDFVFDAAILLNHSSNTDDQYYFLRRSSLFLLAGLLSGLGTALGSGCTSGHMLCGMARGSKRSIVATSVFFPIAILTHRVLKPLMATIGLAPSGVDSLYHGFSNFQPTTLGRILCGALFVWPCTSYLALKLFAPGRLIPLRLGLLGATFGSGLALSGMTKPSIVLGFFNFPLPTWDPSLLGVAVAGLGLNTLAYWAYIQPRIKSWLAARQLVSNESANEVERALLENMDRLAPSEANPPVWRLPEMTNNAITTRLILGSSLFGLGWGLAGICPGPALVAFGAYPLSLPMWSWVIGFFAGSKVIG